MTVLALCDHTCSSELTPTRRYTDGKDSFAWRSCSACLVLTSVVCTGMDGAGGIPKMEEIVYACHVILVRMQ